jgi:hypothetical protein
MVGSMSNPLGMTAAQCVLALEDYERRFVEMVRILDRPGALSPSDIEKARNLLRGLKADLKIDADVRNKDRNRKVMSEIELAHFAPAVQQASADLSIRINSSPSSEWIANLEYARVSISHALHGLKHRD